MLPLFGLSLAFSVSLCVHAYRTGQDSFWIWIILMAQPLGGVVYLLAVVLPQAAGGSTARRLGAAARTAIDPTRAYREAQAAVEDSPTVGNRMRLAAAAAGLGRHDEAEALYHAAAQGIHEDDPALLMGRAQALVELGRNEEALVVLKALGDTGEKGRTAQAALAMGRAYHALGRFAEADTAYEWASGRFPGLEAIARYAIFLEETGRHAEAEAALKDMDRRVAGAKVHFRKEARTWRDFAAAAIRDRGT